MDHRRALQEEEAATCSRLRAEAAQSQAPLREKAMRWLGVPQSRAELAAA